MIRVHAVRERNIRNVVELTNMKFNKGQTDAIMHVTGPMMVIAGPGSGKTTVITRRIQYLIESAGVSPADILVISFTRAAALEMENRFKSLTRGQDYQVRFGTFHSIFFWIIKTAYNLGNSCVITEDEKRKPFMHVLRVYDGIYGACAMLNKKIMSEVCDQLECDLVYILPSSVHEIIVIKAEHMDVEALKNMVCEINEVVVGAEEFLADNVYQYSRNSCELKIAELRKDVMVA